MFALANRPPGKLLYLLFCIALPQCAMAEIGNSDIGMVIMHGRGGSPKKFVADLASSLEAGYPGKK